VFFRAGKAREGWFSRDDVLAQAERAIQIFNSRHPHFQMLAMYDNATTHQARPDNGLTAYGMPLNAHATWKKKGSKVRMRDGKLPNRQPQQLYFPDNHPTQASYFKGMRHILQERGLWTDGLRAQCANFKCADGAIRCCARRLIFNQPDFSGQQSALEELFESYGHILDFYPKFHCELNFIEMYWGAVKREYRSSARTSGGNEMEANVTQCLDSVSPLRILRCVDSFLDRS
jgi:hypothetical protein